MKSVFVMVLAVLFGLLATALDQAYAEILRYQTAELEAGRCQETCVHNGKLRVETVTEPDGCYCADYEAIHPVKIGDWVH